MGTNSVEGPVFEFSFTDLGSGESWYNEFFPEESLGLDYHLCFMKNNTVTNLSNFVGGGSVIYQGTDEYGNNFEITINNSHSTGNTYSILSESETFVATLNFINYPIGFEFSYSS